MDYFPKVGEVIRRSGSRSRWLYIGSVEGYFYVVREGHHNNVRLYEDDELKNWELAPEPFFEEGETYRTMGGNEVYIHHVTAAKVNGAPLALAENVKTGNTFTLNRAHVRAYDVK